MFMWFVFIKDQNFLHFFSIEILESTTKKLHSWWNCLGIEIQKEKWYFFTAKQQIKMIFTYDKDDDHHEWMNEWIDRRVNSKSKSFDRIYIYHTGNSLEIRLDQKMKNFKNRKILIQEKYLTYQFDCGFIIHSFDPSIIILLGRMMMK